MPEKRTHTSKEEVHRLLNQYRTDIANGMPDSDLVALTGLPARTVQRWRLSNGLKRPRGLEAKNAADVFALSLLGEGLGDVKHRTARSVVDGRWTPPVFVTREHLDYDLFLKVLDAAYRILGLTEEEISRGLGVSRLSVEQGLALYDRQRADSGKRCPTCKALMNTTDTALFCSVLCRDTYAEKQ